MISRTTIRPGRWWEQYCCQFCYLVSSSPVQLHQRRRSQLQKTVDWWRTWSRGWSISKSTTFSLGWALYPLQLPHVDLWDYSVDRIMEFYFIDMKNNISFPSFCFDDDVDETSAWRLEVTKQKTLEKACFLTLWI